MARNEQLVRQHKILQLLENSRLGKTTEELRDELVAYLGLSSLHTRSVQRDLEALQAAGIDVDAQTSPRGRVWKLGPNFRGAHKITASATELIALSLSRDLLLPLAGTPFWIALETFWNKLRQSLPETVWKHYQEYRETLRVHGVPAKSYERWHGMLSTLHRSIAEHRVTLCEYQSLTADQFRTYRMHPLGVVVYQSSLYIVAEVEPADPSEASAAPSSAASSPRRGKPASAPAPTQQPPQPDEPRIAHFKLDRFRKVTAMDQWFKPPPGFDLAAHLRQSVGIFSGRSGSVQKFRIRLSRYAAPWVREDPWHAEQQLESQPDGSVILTVPAAHELDVIPRVLALGSEAELLSPAASRRQLAAILQELARKYAAGKE